jgi:iron complex outermembrane recepter protein
MEMSMNANYGKFFALCGLVIFAVTASAQSDSTRKRAYDSLSLKELLNVKIVSVSKSSELLFDAPLSGSVITKEEIRRAGSTSIMEALRLVPGVIVREQANGIYDIHLRGMDNVPPDAPFEITSNTTTLLMVDNRPTYSYLRGGTFWETLPVDINDVERIEVVRGPAAALYGPNAVSGVINIITRTFKKHGLHGVLNTQHGSNQTSISNASLAYSMGKLNVGVSGNYQHRHRSQTSYYAYDTNQWIENPEYLVNFIGDTMRDINSRYPEKKLAMEKYAGNLFAAYEPAARITFNLSAGMQYSRVQKILSETKITPFSTNESDTKYADLRMGIKDFTAQVSYNGGTQVKEFYPGNKYDFQTLDINAEYNYTRGNLAIKPGVSYRSALYDDTRYSDILNKTGVFNARGEITTQSAFIRGDYKLLDNRLRLVAGLTANKFNYPDTTYLSYQFAATYKINKKHLVRMVFSRAPRSSNIYDSYVDQIVSYFPIGVNKYYKTQVHGNKELQLLTASMFEIGYRARVTPKINFFMEAFLINSKNYSAFVQFNPYQYLDGSDTILVQPIMALNLPLELKQAGVTVSLLYNTSKFHFKPFVTIQNTNARHYAPFLNMPYNGMDSNVYSGIGTKMYLKSTPAIYGGFNLNYMPMPKWNINLNTYYYSAQTYTHVANIIYWDGVRGIDRLPAKWIVNARVAYQPVKGMHVFINAKNLLSSTSREFYKADRVPFMLLGGLNYEF